MVFNIFTRLQIPESSTCGAPAPSQCLNNSITMRLNYSIGLNEKNKYMVRGDQPGAFFGKQANKKDEPEIFTGHTFLHSSYATNKLINSCTRSKLISRNFLQLVLAWRS
jgi:hypothetical protein